MICVRVLKLRAFFLKKPNFSDKSDEIFPEIIFAGTFYPGTVFPGTFYPGTDKKEIRRNP